MSTHLHVQDVVHERRHHSLQKALLICGFFSSLLYVFMNTICAFLYPGYSAASQTVSELSAIDAPTRPLWVSLGIIYGLLVILFGCGLWQSANIHRRLPTLGVILIINSIIGFFWPPMHQREVIAAGGGTLTDTLHIAFTAITVPLMIAAIVIGATAFGKLFRIYSIITLLILLFFGILTGLEGPKLSSNLPTPSIGIWERINIGAYMLWIAALSVILLNKIIREPLKTQ
jgi:hypothetical protein